MLTASNENSEISSDSDIESRSISPHRPFTPKQLGQKRPQTESSFTNSLKCKICSDYYESPIVQCQGGHSFCQKCSYIKKDSNSKYICITCNKQISTEMRNFIIEEQLEKVNVNCRWAIYGCSEIIQISQLKKHEMKCQFKSGISCIFSQLQNKPCSYFAINNNDLVRHFQTHVEDQSIEVNGNKAKFLVKIELPKELENEAIQIQLLKVKKNIENQHQLNPFPVFIRKKIKEYLFIFKSYYDPKEKVFVFMLNTIGEQTAEYNLKLTHYQWEMEYKTHAYNFSNTGLLQNYAQESKKGYIIVHQQQLVNLNYFNQSKPAQYIVFNLGINLME